MLSRKIPTTIVLSVFIFLAGCVRRDGRNSDCQWPAEPNAKALQLNQRDDARHLREDMEFGEELAIEYMDAHHGPRSGEFKSQQAASQALNACLVKLAGQIGQSHHIAPNEVARSFGRRSLATDVAVILPFLVLYCLLAGMLAGWLLRRYPPEDSWTATLVLGIPASLASGVGGMLVGEQWSVLAESIRVGTGHLSYRQDRLPSVQHEIEFFFLCLVLFWAAAVIRYRMRHQRR